MAAAPCIAPIVWAERYLVGSTGARRPTIPRLLVFAAIIASLGLYLGPVRRSRRTGSQSSDQYFTSRNSVDPSQFAAAQIAYALQMATIYPFFIFAYGGQWWIAIINTTFYAVGIALYRFLLPSFSKGTSDLLDVPRTVHAAIADLNDVPFLRSFTAGLTIIAFAGLATFETVWGARALKVVLGGSDALFYMSVIVLAAYLIAWVWIGGQAASIRADQYQLFLSYVGLHVLVAWIAWQPKVSLDHLGFPLIGPLIVAVSGLMLLYRIRTVPWRTTTGLLRYLNIFTLISLGMMVLSLFLNGSTFWQALSVHVNWSAIQSATTQKDALLIAVSVGILPLFFQFVDMTNWQRLASVQATEGQRVALSLRGLALYLIESPLSWLLPIFVGMGAAAFLVTSKNGDPWTDLLSVLLLHSDPIGVLIAIVVFVGLIAVFLSTAVELLSGIGYAASYDLVPMTRRLVDASPFGTDHQTLRQDSTIKNVGRWSFALATSAVVLAFIAADYFLPGGGDRLVGLFLAFYTPLIAMAPALIIPATTGRRAAKGFAVASIVVGAGAGLVLGFISAFAPNLYDGAIAWLASPVSTFVAWLIYLIGLPFGKRTSKAPPLLAAGSAQ